MSPHVKYLWKDREADKLTPSGRLIYRSNQLGSDGRITNTGGGNTSAKLIEKDPDTGAPIDVLWVKGSGGDLRTSTLENFASLYQDKLIGLQSVYAGDEDAMVERYPDCAFNGNPRAPSIDTPLHSFVPYKHVDHMHPNTVIAIAASRRSRELTQEVFGDEVGWTPWLRPGFKLGLELQRRCHEEPRLKGVVLAQHGLINWADDDRECYHLTLRLIERAAAYIEARDKGDQTFGGPKHFSLDPAAHDDLLFDLLPWLRERAASGKRCIATVDSSPAILRFVNSHDAPRLAQLGTSCPDHFLRTKIRPLFVPWNPAGGDVNTLRGLL
ncbi:MAG TPA: class II aldolase/adducin family protein, partial [Bryobacteraceae bacterium]